MKSLFELDPNTRDHLNRANLIENYMWEIARTVYPGTFIEPEMVTQARDALLEAFRRMPPGRRV